jgi:hypothetical protein
MRRLGCLLVRLRNRMSRLRLLRLLSASLRLASRTQPESRRHSWTDRAERLALFPELTKRSTDRRTLRRNMRTSLSIDNIPVFNL